MDIGHAHTYCAKISTTLSSKHRKSPSPVKIMAKRAAAGKADGTRKTSATKGTKRKRPIKATTPSKHVKYGTPPPITGPLPTFILDTGGWTLKHGTIFPSQDNPSHSVPIAPSRSLNLSAKPKHQLTMLISNQIHTIHNKSQLTYSFPLERGYTSDLATQLQIWSHVLEQEHLNPIHSQSRGGLKAVLPSLVKGGGGSKRSNNSSPMEVGTLTHAACVMLLAQPFTPRGIIEREDEVWFRDFGFGRVVRRLGACCSAHLYLKECEMPEFGKGDKGGSEASHHVRTSGVKNDGTACCCVVDSGFSVTHIVPTVKSNAIEKAIRRINLGGKVLTNLLKQTISYRQWNMMDEFYLVNDVKEQLCYVSMNPRKETKMANLVKEGKRWFDREYVLPDFVQTFSGSVRLPAALLREQMLKDKEVQKSSIHNDEGRVKSGATQVLNGKVNTVQNDCDEHIQDKADENDSDSENESEEHARQRILKQREEERKRRELEEQERQVLSVSTERFSVPEIMFHPKDVGLDQVSLSEGIHQAIQACDNIHRGAMYNNIVLTGGNIKMLYLRDRVEKEVRSLAPDQYDVRVFLPDDPVTYAWRGAQDYICSSGFMCNGSVDRFDWERLKEENKSVDEIWGDSNLPEGLVTI